MTLRFVSTLAVCLFLTGVVPPAYAQQDGEQEAGAKEGEQGNGDEEAAKPPSLTLVHYGPDSAGGSLASLYPDQALELGQGETAFTGLLKRERTPERHGGILVVAPSGRSPDQGLAGAIRTQLPESGWMTLSIAQPAEPVAELPERVLEPRQAEGNEQEEDDGEAEEGNQAGDEDAADQEAESPDLTIQVAQGTDELTEREDNWRTRAMERMEAAVNALREEGVGATALVGIGDGADLVLRYVRANGATFPPDGLGMVWLDAHLRPPFSNGLAEELGEGYQVPVLDLYDRDHRAESADARAAAARRGGFAAYTQSAIPLPRGGDAREQRRVPARIRGWLSNNLKSAEGN